MRRKYSARTLASRAAFEICPASLSGTTEPRSQNRPERPKRMVSIPAATAFRALG